LIVALHNTPAFSTIGDHKYLWVPLSWNCDRYINISSTFLITAARYQCGVVERETQNLLCYRFTDLLYRFHNQ